MYLVETGPKPEPSPATPAVPPGLKPEPSPATPVVPPGQDYSSFTYVLGNVLSKHFKYYLF